MHTESNDLSWTVVSVQKKMKITEERGAAGHVFLTPSNQGLVYARQHRSWDTVDFDIMTEFLYSANPF